MQEYTFQVERPELVHARRVVRHFQVWLRASAKPSFVFVGCGNLQLTHTEPLFCYVESDGYVKISDYTVTELHQ